VKQAQKVNALAWVGALAFFHDVLGPSHVGSHSKIKIWMTGGILCFKVSRVIQSTNQAVLPQTCRGALELAFKGWRSSQDSDSLAEFI